MTCSWIRIRTKISTVRGVCGTGAHWPCSRLAARVRQPAIRRRERRGLGRRFVDVGGDGSSTTVCPLKRQLEDAKTWTRASLKEVAAPNGHQVKAGVIVGPVGSAHHRSASDHDVLPLLVVAVMVRATMIVMRIETALRILATSPRLTWCGPLALVTRRDAPARLQVCRR